MSQDRFEYNPETKEVLPMKEKHTEELTFCIFESLKSRDIVELIADFDCGGDSMQYFELQAYKKDRIPYESLSGDKELDDVLLQIEDLTFKNVEFYEVSDGNYLGESGTVTIKPLYEEQQFIFIKSSEEQYQDTLEVEAEIPLTEEEAQFLKDNVQFITKDAWDNEDAMMVYKKDVVMTDQKKQLHDAIIHKIHDEADNVSYDNHYSLEQVVDYELDTDYGFGFMTEEGSTGGVVITENNNLKCTYSQTFRYGVESMI